MAMFVPMTAGVEVNGETVLSIVAGLGTFKSMALTLLKKHGIDNPKAGAWYSQQAWLDAFKEISGSLGGSTLFNIGQKIPESAVFPPQINDIQKALGAIDVAFHMNHRMKGKALFNPENGMMSEGIGHYTFKSTGPTEARMVCKNSYPCDFDRGIIEGMARKFKPDGSHVLVQHDESAPCRKKGADSCEYIVRW